MMKESVLNNVPTSSVTNRIFAAAGVLGIAAGALVLRQFNPVTAGFFPGCFFHQMTGLNCPGCGLTRGFHQLFNGDILSALHFNAVLPLYSFVFGYLIVSLILVAVRGRGLSWKLFQPTTLWIIFGTLLIFGIVRNLPFYPFNLLAI